MVKRIWSLITLLVLVLTECFTPMSYVLAENDAEQDFQIEENIIQEEDIGDSLSDREEETQNDDNEEENIQESSDDVLEWQEDMEDEEEDVQNSSVDTQDDKNEEENENLWVEIEDNGESEEGDNPQNSSTEILETQTWSEVDTSNLQENNQENGENNIQDNEEQNTQDSSVETPEIQTWTQTWSGVDTWINIPQWQEKEKEWWVIETITEEIQEIITKIRYFFKREWDSRYIKYGRDWNNVGTITLKDPKTWVSITIMDKNLWAESVGVERSSYGNYFQWWNNSGVKTVNWWNKTAEKAVYKDSYYNRGYDGKWKFIVWGVDYWENGDHYNSLWWNESKESTRYWACPIGYHIPTVKEWNQLLSIWWKIHTQDTTKNGTVLRYSADYAAKNIHTFKWAATQCAQWENECVDEDKLSIIIETLSEELKLPLAWSYDENGNYEEGLWVYWTTVAKDGSKAWVFDMNVYIWNWADERLQYKSQWHNIRCFQNVDPYEAPEEIEDQEEEGIEVWSGENVTGGNIQNDENQWLQESDVYTIWQQEAYTTWLQEDNVYTTWVQMYTITWKNEDWTIRDTTQVAYGEMPKHEDITQLADEKYTYTFAWWEPEIRVVDWDAEYKAKYIYTANKSTITWKNEDGTIIDTTEVLYGEMPTHEDAYQPADAKYTYVFKWWEPEILNVVWPAEYMATYEYILNTYTVTWKNEDWSILEEDKDVEYGTMPTYDGENPVKQWDWNVEYIFSGWETDISGVTSDVVYVAKYDVVEISEDNGSGSDVVESNDLLEDMGNNDSILSWMEWNVDGWEWSWDEIIEIEDSLDETSEWEEQWFFEWLWKTLKSFFLADEDGYLKWSETINDIVVSVEAEEWTFPAWTEVVIKWVSEDRLETIQTSLVEDENNNITENAQIVAFDISFVYSWEEIQPTKEVSVKFNYKDNLDFQWVSTSQVSVYHIDDETDEGQKVEVANNDGNEIEILTSDFSVYVLALTEDNNITLTLNPWDWTIITWDNIIVNEQWIWTITSVNGNVTLPNATRDNHVFVWWYTSQTSSLQGFAWNWWDQYHVNADITLYAKWCNNWYAINTNKTTCILEWNLKTILDQNPNFIWWEKEIPMPLWWTNEEDPISIVIMDRNLWATAHGTESNAWWYYYQWWNNYGFTQNPPTIRRDTANVNLSLYAPSTYYSWTYIIWKVGNTTFPGWATTENYNIWWYYSGTNEAKQWPCPTNWHVPTIEEWNKVVEYWSWNNGWMNVPNFRAELGLPLAWWLTRSTAALESGNIAWFYRTVTPNTSKTFAYDFLVKSDSYDVNYSENLVNWRQVRCFKNEDAIVRRYTVTYNDGIDNREIFEDQIFSWLLRWDDFPQFSWQIPWRTGNDWTYHEFLWWFLEWTEIAFNVSGAKVIENVLLYAMWTWCPDGEEPNALGFCVPTAEEQRNRQIVQDLELYLLASDQNKIHYTIMDRNMWATEIFNKYYDAPNPASLGYLYQWWNNYWFPAQWNLAQQWVFIRTSQVPKNIWSVWVPSNYASGTYYSNAGSHTSWMGSSSKTDWIWWWTWDTTTANGVGTTSEARKWPCPIWYHVPSTLEWKNIFIDWSGVNVWLNVLNDTIYKFSEDLLLPPVWRRAENGALDSKFSSAMSYWSSSPDSTNAIKAAWIYLKTNDAIQPQQSDWRARARSVRCVKNVVNTSATSISTDDIHLDGWWNVVISIDNWVISTLWTPTRVDSTFNGWYTTPDFSWNPLSTWDTVSAWSSLYAKFTCNQSWYVWNGTSCEDGVRLIFDSMWWSDVPSQTVKSGTTWVRPSDPTKTWYVFSGWFLTWANEEFNFTWTIITESTTLYAHWNTWQYEVSIVSNNEDYGTVNGGLVTADFWTPIFTNWNELTIWFTTVIATPATSGEQYTYTFSGWTFENCGIEWTESVTMNCEITANFDRSVNSYDVTFDSDGWDYTPDVQNVEYWSTATKPIPDPTKTWYEFSGWTLNWLDFDFSTPIIWTSNLVAKWNLVEYTITYNLDWWINDPNNPDTYTIESWAITLQQPIKTWYIFLWWTWSNGGVAQTWVIIPSWSDWNKIYNAVWQSSNVEYIIYHYVKKIWENKYILVETETWHWRTDDVLTLSSLSKESQYPCASYDRWSLTWTENWPWEIVTETTIKWDGSTKICLYYSRNSYTVHLSWDAGIQRLEINGEETTEAVRECGSEVPVSAVPKPWYHLVRWDREERKEGE